MKFFLTIIVLLFGFSSPSHAMEIDQAARLVNEHLRSLNIDLTRYKLISAQNLYINGDKYIGPKKWFLTYQLRSFIPVIIAPFLVREEKFLFC